MKFHRTETLISSLFLVLFLPTLCAKTNIESFLTDINLESYNSGIHPIDCIYVINLEYRPEKWTNTRASLNAYGINPNRVNAVNGWLLNEQEKQTLMGRYPLKIVGGHMGCMLSHLSTIQHAFRQAYEFVWICEDDIQVCENPHQLSNLISDLSTIDPEWDILYTDSDSKNSLGELLPSLSSDFRPDFPYMDLNYYLKREIINQDLMRLHQRFGAYSYIVSKRGIEKIWHHLIHNYFWAHYDIEIHYIPGIRQYCVSRDLVSINWTTPSDTVCNIEQQ